MVTELVTRNLIDQIEHLSLGLQTIASSAGRAPAAAWEPLGPEMHRSHDVWVAFPENDWKARTAELVPGPEEGLRLRLVLRELDAEADLLRLRPVLESLPSRDYRFVHAEIMQGPEEGVFLAVDNRLPALLTQLHWPDSTVEKLEEPFGGLPQGHPVHANVVVHDLETPLTGWFGEQPLARQLLSLRAWLNQRRLPLHQLSLGRLRDPRGGVSVGLECITQERGSQGGFQA